MMTQTPTPTATPIYSMTGFARHTGTTPSGLAFTLSLKSVNHRFLDLQFHLPYGMNALDGMGALDSMDTLEMHWRSLLKQHIARGHVDVRLSLHPADATRDPSIPRPNPTVIRAYMEAFRTTASEYGISAHPDLNVALQLPGAWNPEKENSPVPSDPTAAELATSATTENEAALSHAMLALLTSLNLMRAQEGQALLSVLQSNMSALDALVAETTALRAEIQNAHRLRLQQRMTELLSGPLDHDRILLEAALLADRSDVEEEMARLRIHIQHFLDLLHLGGPVGKKLDFLLQEMGREANTLLSKTGGMAGKTLRLTELGLAMKSEIERAREQIQNIE